MLKSISTKGILNETSKSLIILGAVYFFADLFFGIIDFFTGNKINNQYSGWKECSNG